MDYVVDDAPDVDPHLAAESLLSINAIWDALQKERWATMQTERPGRAAADIQHQLLQFVQSFLDISSRSVFWKDRHSVYRGCNRNFAKSAGLSDPGSVVGKTDYDLPWPREQAQFFRKIDRLVMSSGQPRYHIIQLQTGASGRNLWVDTSKIPLYDQAGDIIGVLGIEEAIHQSGERFLLSEKEIKVGCWEWNPVRERMVVDATTKAILGLAGADSSLSMIEFMRMVHPDDSVSVRNGMNGLLQQFFPLYEKQHRIIQPNGTVRWVQVRGSAIYDAQVQGPKIGGTISDLSAIAFSENEPEHRAAILEAITRSSQNLLATADLNNILPDILRILGRAIGYGRAYLLRNSEPERLEGAIMAQQHACWATYDEYTATPKLQPARFTYEEIGLGGWLNELRAGQPIHGLLSEYPRREQRYLADQEVVSFIWIPVFCEGEWWGVLGFDDRMKRAPRQTEIEVLRNAAAAIGSAIAQHQSQQAEHEQRVLAEALRDTARVLNSTLNLDEVLDRILSEIGKVVPHEAGNVLLVEGEQARIVRTRTAPQSSFRTLELERDFSVTAFPVLKRMMETGKSLIAGQQEQVPFADTSWGMDWARSYAGTPIQREGKVIGYINLFSQEETFFKTVHAERLQAFADQAAIAIGNARLYRQAQELAMLEERQRLARELHDSVNQTLWTASMFSDIIPDLWDQNPDDGRRSLEKLRQLNRAAVAEMRALLLELRPSELTATNLSHLMHQLAEATMSRKNIAIRLDAVGDAQLEPNNQVAIYRIAQEALNNVAKHSQATEVTVELRYDRHHVDLSISDNGRGFDPNVVRPSALGLKIMRERADSIGARIQISSTPNQGTRVFVSWASPAFLEDRRE